MSVSRASLRGTSRKAIMVAPIIHLHDEHRSGLGVKGIWAGIATSAYAGGNVKP